MPTDTKAETKSPAKTAERPTVSLPALVAEFGAAEGEAKYFAIARLEGEFIHPVTLEKYTGRYFFDPATEHNYRPDLVIATLPTDARKAVADIISTPQMKES